MRHAVTSVALAAMMSTACAAASKPELQKTEGQDMEVHFADNSSPKWDGLAIPAGQQCTHDGATAPSTPPLRVANIPAGADSLVFVYSDRDYTPMNNGGHGIFQYALPSGDREVTVPSVPANTSELPAGFTIIAEHRGTSKGEPGAYMPPCSGGKGHSYFVTVQAVKGYSVVAEAVLELGKY